MNAKYTYLLAVTCVGLLGIGCSGDEEPATELEIAKTELKRYEDLSVALSEGFVSGFHYVSAPNMGGMGVHFINPAITTIDPMTPNVLMYDVTDSGAYELAGVEWVVPADTVEEAPVLFGQTFDGPMPGHEEGMPEHYELHVWLYKENPEGMFAGFNPALSAPSWWADIEAAHSAAEALSTSDDATSAGYVSTQECVAEEGMGAMGVHWVNQSITTVDATKPQVLLFDSSGESDRLVGVEWLVPSDAVEEAPVLFGQTFEGPFPGHEEGMPEHYELHVWLNMANPDGMFAAFNPALSCP